MSHGASEVRRGGAGSSQIPLAAMFPYCSTVIQHVFDDRFWFASYLPVPARPELRDQTTVRLLLLFCYTLNNILHFYGGLQSRNVQRMLRTAHKVKYLHTIISITKQ